MFFILQVNDIIHQEIDDDDAKVRKFSHINKGMLVKELTLHTVSS